MRILAAALFPLASASAFKSVSPHSKYLEEDSPSEVAANVALLGQVVDSAKRVLSDSPVVADYVLNTYKHVFVPSARVDGSGRALLLRYCQGALSIPSICEFHGVLTSAEGAGISESNPVYRLAVHKLLADLNEAVEVANTKYAFGKLIDYLYFFQTDPVITSAIVSQLEYLVGLSNEYESVTEANKPEQVSQNTWTDYVERLRAAMRDHTKKPHVLAGHRVEEVRRLRIEATEALKLHEQKQKKKGAIREVDVPEVTLLEISKLAVAAIKEYPIESFADELIACYGSRDGARLTRLRNRTLDASVKEKLTSMLELFEDVRPEEWRVDESRLEYLRVIAGQESAALSFSSLISYGQMIVEDKDCSNEIIQAVVGELRYITSFTTPGVVSSLHLINVLKDTAPADKHTLLSAFARKAQQMEKVRHHLVGHDAEKLNKIVQLANNRLNRYHEEDAPAAIKSKYQEEDSPY